ncbi:MAG: UDP-N-acetylmuramoyl-tripeptide--D-alanyl-D-alanine ligase [Calditrichia bacterium]
MKTNSHHRALIDFLNGYPCQAKLSSPETGYLPLSIDSRTIAAGDLFIAIKGENHDGHDYAATALEKEAGAVVVQHDWLAAHPLEGDVVAVDNTLDFLQQLAAWHRGFYGGQVIGVTGSNGKTTTREMIAAVLAEGFSVFRSEGNKNNHIGLPLMLLDLDFDSKFAILEMGTNHPGEIGLLASLAKPDDALVTNVGKGHVGFFDGLDAIYEEKTALLDAVESGTIFINMEDERLRNYKGKAARSIRVGLTADCEVWGMLAELDDLGCATFLLNGETNIKLAIPGEHQLMNALFAAAVGLNAGLSVEQIKKALEAFRPTGKRMEYFRRDGILYLNDAYNANPDSMAAAIRYLAAMKEKGGRAVLVMGDMLELGDFEMEEHQAMGRLAVDEQLDLVLLYGPASKAALSEIRGNADQTECNWYSSHEAIADHLQDYLQKGDIVLLKGSRGMRMETVLSHMDVAATGR